MSGERSNNDIFGGSPGDRAKMTGMPVRNTMKDDFGLDIPTELVRLVERFTLKAHYIMLRRLKLGL